MARTGPVTKDTSTVALGLAKILVGSSADNISEKDQTLNESDDSLGALNSTSFSSDVEFWRMSSGFPALEDLVIPLRENAQLECEFRELHPRNLAYARGLDASSGYDNAHSGEINLGDLKEPAYVRMEAIYTYPNQTNHMYIIFPRAQVTSSMDLSFAQEDNANVPITIESKRADSEVSGGDAAWDNSPLGRIYFD
jgi:hypothetical protein